MSLALGMTAALGTYLLYTAVVFGWRGLGPDHRSRPSFTPRARLRQWMNQAGLVDVSTSEFVGAVAGVTLVGGAGGFAIFGAALPAAAVAVFSGVAPVTSYRLRREAQRASAREAWPRMIEEIRLRTGSLGRSIPQALFEVGARGPDGLRPAFEAAHREWLLTTDFERTVNALKSQLSDPTADVVCETLLVAHELGGADLGRRLTALGEDRILDLQGRKDARAKQAGARLARRFVLLVPIGMALAGMQVGAGRSAYGTALGQTVALVAVGLVALCWLWAGAIMRLPDEERVFS